MKTHLLAIILVLGSVLTACEGTKPKSSAAVANEKKTAVTGVHSAAKKPASTSPAISPAETRTVKSTERTIKTTTVVAGDDEIKASKN